MSKYEQLAPALTPEEQATIMSNDILAEELWQSSTNGRESRERTVRLDEDRSVYVSQSRDSATQQITHNVIQFRSEPKYRAPKNALAYWRVNGDELSNPNIVQDVEVEPVLQEARHVAGVSEEKEAPSREFQQIMINLASQDEWLEGMLDYNLKGEAPIQLREFVDNFDMLDMANYISDYYALDAIEAERAIELCDQRLFESMGGEFEPS